jgi:hypothetical protein
VAKEAVIQFYRGDLAGITTLAEGEPAWTTDTNELYIGSAGGNVLIGPSMSSPLTTKGDIWVYTTDNARLPVGTDGYVLTADSTQASGLKWDAPAVTYTNEEAQDAVGTILVDSDTIDFTYADATPSITAAVRTQMSLTSDASGLKLVSDDSAPGYTYAYYGCDEGVKGWYDLDVKIRGLTSDLIDSNALDVNSDLSGIHIDVVANSLPITALTNATTGSLLVGRRGGSNGEWEEVTLGTGLSMSAGAVLSCSVTGYTDEQARDAVGAMLTDTATIDLTYDDTNNLVTADLKAASVNLANHVTGTLPDDNGGTGQSTYATGDMLYASGANTLAKLAAGANNDWLQLVGGVPTWTTPMADLAYGSMSGDYTVKASWGDIDIDDIIPEKGTYLIIAHLGFRCQVSSGQGAIRVRLYNQTNGAAVANSERRMVSVTGQDITNWTSATAIWVYTYSGGGGGPTLKVQAIRETLFSPVWVMSSIQNDSSCFSVVRIY